MKYVFMCDLKGNKVPEIVNEYPGQKFRNISFINAMPLSSKCTFHCLLVILDYFSLASWYDVKFCQ